MALFQDEAVVRLAVVEAPDDVVAIAPGVGTLEIIRVAGRVGVAGDVEPVTAPAHTVARRAEQPLDKILVGCIGRVGEERLDLLRRGRQAGQVESDAANQRQFIGPGSRRERFLGKLCQQEGIDRRADEGRIGAIPWRNDAWRHDFC